MVTPPSGIPMPQPIIAGSDARPPSHPFAPVCPPGQAGVSRSRSQRMRRSRVELYQAKAEACRQQATLRQKSSVKDRWLKLAEQWSALAAKEKKDRPRSARGETVSSPVHIETID